MTKKHLFSFAATAAMACALLTSCHVEKPLGMHFATFADSVVETRFKTTVKVDLPQDNAHMDHFMQQQINTILGGSFEGKLFDGDALATHYATEAMKRLKAESDTTMFAHYSADEMQLTEDVSVQVVENTPQYCSLLENYYAYLGGAHGGARVRGYTFIKPMGMRFDELCYEKNGELHALLVEGLKTYFEVDSNEALLECLMGFDNSYVELIPFPDTTPYLDKGKLVFIYQQYEIAPYAAGMPEISIPLEKAKAFIRPNIYKLLTEGAEGEKSH